MDLNTRKILSLFASILFTIPVYIILHEGGHALIALSCGARITEFSILGAYMRYEGGTFTALTLSLFYIAGMLLPVLISIAYMLLYRDAAQSVFYRIFSFLFPLILTAPALAWGIVPLLYLSDQAPPGDDVTGFIESSGASPWAVLLGAVLLFGRAVSFWPGRERSSKTIGLLSGSACHEPFPRGQGCPLGADRTIPSVH